MRRKLTILLVLLASCTMLGTAVAHWCSNIFVARARIIVKPEKTTVVLSSTPTPLRVYLQNNFPYKIRAYMRASSSGYIDPTEPSSGYHDIHPGQNVSYVFSLTGSGSTPVSTLNLQMKFRHNSTTLPNNDPDPSAWTWRDDSNSVVNQSPTQSQLVSGTGHSQSGSLEAAMLAERFPSATLASGTPYFGRTGMQQLIHWFGYRFCYGTGGDWRCTSQNCPSPCAEGNSWTSIQQFPQLAMRAGAEVAARKAQLGSDLGDARLAAINALKGGGSGQHKCLAAVVGGYLHKGVTATTFLAELADTTNNGVPGPCQNAGIRAQGGTTPGNCSSGAYYERAACAAAEGLSNNNGPVISVLMVKAGDGMSGRTGYMPTGDPDYDGLYYSYMLYIVQAYRKGGVTGSGTVPFYPDAGTSSCSTVGDCDDGNVCTTDACTNNACEHTPVAGCCNSAGDCDDSDPCTTDTCTSNSCGHAPVTGCCTSAGQCDDSDICTTDTCTNNACAHAPVTNCCTAVGDCDDNDVCTTDACTSNTCSNTAISGCCTAASQCNDSDPCTADNCTSNACSNTAISGCCTANTQCNDNNTCTTDACTGNVCVFTPVPNCCTTNAQCNDSNPCTTDTCNVGTGTCSNVAQAGCCAFDTDCNDSNPCTADTCVSNACQHSAVTGCCTTNAQCDDSDPCTTDTCASNTCQHTPVASCCTTNADCDDSDPCTTDTCANSQCQHAAVSGCCTTDADCNDADPCTADTCSSNACTHSAIQCDFGVPKDLGSGDKSSSGDLGPTADVGIGPDQKTPSEGQNRQLDGGCSMGGTPRSGSLLLLLLGLLWLRRRD